eukprot:gene734-18_t
MCSQDENIRVLSVDYNRNISNFKIVSRTQETKYVSSNSLGESSVLSQLYILTSTSFTPKQDAVVPVVIDAEDTDVLVLAAHVAHKELKLYRVSLGMERNPSWKKTVKSSDAMQLLKDVGQSVPATPEVMEHLANLQSAKFELPASVGDDEDDDQGNASNTSSFAGSDSDLDDEVSEEECKSDLE